MTLGSTSRDRSSYSCRNINLADSTIMVKYDYIIYYAMYNTVSIATYSLIACTEERRGMMHTRTYVRCNWVGGWGSLVHAQLAAYIKSADLLSNISYQRGASPSRV